MRKALDQDTLKAVYDRVAPRYDVQHGLLTAHADQRGRALLVERAVAPGNTVLDCGAGTGSTGLLAAQRVGTAGRVVLFDSSEGMLRMAEKKAAQAHLRDRLEIRAGDMLQLPFADDSFDVVLSSYSLCPVQDPGLAAAELYRVTRPGGRIGIAHSTEPAKRMVKWLADRVEDLVWQLPAVSLGCRAVTVLPTLEKLGCRLRFQRRIGVPLWPFLVFVVEKPPG